MRVLCIYKLQHPASFSAQWPHHYFILKSQLPLSLIILEIPPSQNFIFLLQSTLYYILSRKIKKIILFHFWRGVNRALFLVLRFNFLTSLFANHVFWFSIIHKSYSLHEACFYYIFWKPKITLNGGLVFMMCRFSDQVVEIEIRIPD